MTIILIFSILFGLAIGSFLNVVIHRMPIGESIVYPRSHCPECNKQLCYKDLIPIVSWLINLGQCRYCKSRINIRYLYVEIITCILFILCVFSNPSDLYAYNPTITIIYGWILVSMIIPLTFIDIDAFWLPSIITNSGILFGLLIYIVKFIQNNNIQNYSIFINHLIATLIIFLTLRGFSYISKQLMNKEILGQGDANLMAMAAAWLGSTGLEIVVIQSILLAGSYSGICMMKGFLKRGEYIPLGAFIGPSIVLTWILGNSFWLKTLGNLLWWRYI